MHAGIGHSVAAAVIAHSSHPSHAYQQRAYVSTNHRSAFEIGHHNICNMARRRGSWFCLRKKCHLYRLKSWPIDLQTPQDGLSRYVVDGGVLFWWQIRVTATVEWQVVGRFFVAMADWHFQSVYPKWEVCCHAFLLEIVAEYESTLMLNCGARLTEQYSVVGGRY